MINKNIDQITEEDIQVLIDNAVLESKIIEYKQSLPGNTDSDKKEFFADISSFANASGGDLIYGVVEDKGVPVSLDGLDIDNIDNEITRFDNIIRTGIEPKLLGITIRSIDLSNNKTAIIIRIPKSWISPHRVTYKGHGHFYTRGANGKYPMDVGELRIAFNLSETIAQRIRMFREDRISKIYANETPVPSYENAKIVLHLIPTISFNPGQRYNIKDLISQPNEIKPISCNSWNYRYNFEGYLTYASGQNSQSYSYLQLYNNGIIEAVDALLLDPNRKHQIPGYSYEEKIINALSRYLDLLKELKIEPPIFIFLSLLGVKGYTMAIRDAYWFDIYPIDRDILLLPEVVIENYNVEAQHILRPCFDSIWNACGLSESLNYDENGDWKAR